MMNRFVKNETVSKFWLTEITSPTPDDIPNTLRICWSEETGRNFFALEKWQTSAVFMCRCTAAWQVRSWRVSYPFFFPVL